MDLGGGDRTGDERNSRRFRNGEVTLAVSYDPDEAAYRFRFIDVDNPADVVSKLQLTHGLAPPAERIIRNSGMGALGKTGFSAAATRSYLVNQGMQLWDELIPAKLRWQFWERQQRITQLTILTDSDVVPWELLYPMDRGYDAGFLVEQFPVTRAIYGRPRQNRLLLHPARFVVPPGSPADAQAEAEALAGLLGTELTTVSELMPLLELIGKGGFGLLHFACHNRLDPTNWRSIRLDTRFDPTFLELAARDVTLASTAPLVFINACRSSGRVPSFNRIAPWAVPFMQAGSAAFIAPWWEFPMA